MDAGRQDEEGDGQQKAGDEHAAKVVASRHLTRATSATTDEEDGSDLLPGQRDRPDHEPGRGVVAPDERVAQTRTMGCATC